MTEPTVLRPGDAGFDAATTGFQTARPHRPDLVVDAAGPDDVRAAVRLAADRGLPWAVQSTGHGRGAPLDGGVLISTARMRDIVVDPVAGTARIAAGARGGDVVAAAAPHGLAPVVGSSPHVGVVGYLLGGGFGILGRRFGWAADRVRAVEAVTADGEVVRLIGPVPPGVAVTAVETGLVPLRSAWAATLSFPASPEVLTGWAGWTADQPDDVTSSVALIPFPDVPALLEPLRGRHVARVTVVATADATDAVAPLRALGPVLDERLRTVPAAEVHTIHADPTDPHAYLGEARLLSGVDPAALAALPDLAGPASPAPSVVEVRHLGGALARSTTVPAAHREARYLLRAVTALGGVSEATARAAQDRIVAPAAGQDLGRAGTFAYGR